MKGIVDFMMVYIVACCLTDTGITTSTKSTQVNEEDLIPYPPTINLCTQTIKTDYYCPATIIKSEPPTPTMDENISWNNTLIVISDDEV